MKKQKEMKNKKKQFEKSSGITLIALVITIVVLIILATISITLTLRDGGIFGASETAKQMQEMAAIKEEADLVKNELLIRSYTEEGVEFNKSTLLQALKDHFEGSTIEGNNKVIVHNGKYEIIVDDNLNISVEKARETQKGDVKLSYTESGNIPSKRINLSIELLGLPEWNYDELRYDYMKNQFLMDKTTQELMEIGGKIKTEGMDLTAEQVYNNMLKADFPEVSYEEFMADKDNKVKEAYGAESADIFAKTLILDMVEENLDMQVGALIPYSKLVVPELVGKGETEIKNTTEGYVGNEYTFDQLLEGMMGEGATLDVVESQVNSACYGTNLFTREEIMLVVAARAYADTHPIIIEYPNGDTDSQSWYTYDNLTYVKYYNISEYGNYTFKVTGASGNTEEITYTIGNITLDKNEMTTQGTLTATLLGLNENDLKWTTSDGNIAEIQGEGTTITVIPKSEGEAIITATCGGYSASCRVKVTGNLTLDKQEISATLLPGENAKQETLTATLTNLNEEDLKWETSDSNIAEIQEEGKTVTVILKSAGEATITATCGKTSTSCKITVNKGLKEGTLLSGWESTKVKAIISEDNVTVPVPIGYTYSMVEGEKSVSTGFVIKKGTDGTATSGVNEFVWVPVSDASFNEMFVTSTTGPIYLSGQSGETGVTTEYYSNLRIRTGDGDSYTLKKPGTSSGVREPDLVTSYDNDSYAVKAGYANLADMAQGFVDDYKNMRESIKKYKGFYIGRYELTGTVDNPTVQSGTVLTTSSSQAGNWYGLYKACRNVAKEGSVTSTMIWGCQWDETMNWLKNTKFKNDKDAVDTDSKTWGNYSNSYGAAALTKADGKNAYGSRQITGYSKEYWSANNICDLAGNYFEFTQEANYTSVRIGRGGYYNDTGSSRPASDRNDYRPSDSSGISSTRATLYVNP